MCTLQICYFVYFVLFFDQREMYFGRFILEHTNVKQKFIVCTTDTMETKIKTKYSLVCSRPREDLSLFKVDGTVNHDMLRCISIEILD